nr:hypothetical protein [Brevundimonas diminuta]
MDLEQTILASGEFEAGLRSPLGWFQKQEEQVDLPTDRKCPKERSRAGLDRKSVDHRPEAWTPEMLFGVGSRSHPSFIDMGSAMLPPCAKLREVGKQRMHAVEHIGNPRRDEAL